MKIFRPGIWLIAVTTSLCLSLSINCARSFAAESPPPALTPEAGKITPPGSSQAGSADKAPTHKEEKPVGKETPQATQVSPPAQKQGSASPVDAAKTPAAVAPDKQSGKDSSEIIGFGEPKPLDVKDKPYVFPKEQVLKKAPSGGKLAPKDEKQLVSRAKKYWELRREGDNKSAYEMEHPKFRQKFKLQGYLPSGSASLELKAVKVLSAEKKLNEPGRALVKVDIKSKIIGIAGGKPIDNQVTMADTWENVKGNWYHVLYVGLFADHDPTKDDPEKGVPPTIAKEIEAKPSSSQGPPAKMLKDVGNAIKGIPTNEAPKGSTPAAPIPGKESAPAKGAGQPATPDTQSQGPGMQPAIPGAKLAGPGMQMSPGPHQGPGMQPEKPGATSAGPGMQMSPGTQSQGPGMQTEKPGAKSAGPGMQILPGAPSSGPGMQSPAKATPAAPPEAAPVKDAPANQ
ncbi:MAG: hypothetical protein HQK58_07320 [Deltaproteobacteria bacterium]|nr:hypothetical protein [Deltaproteobacteria bacterium]